MVAGLLYLIGLVTVLITIALVGYGAPGIIQTFSAAMDAGSPIFGVLSSIAASLSWALYQIVGGLALMGLGRVIMRLASINRSLRGQG